MQKKIIVVMLAAIWYLTGVFGVAMRRHDLVHYTHDQAKALADAGQPLDPEPPSYEEVNAK